jgi:hypothetical protein
MGFFDINSFFEFIKSDEVLNIGRIKFKSLHSPKKNEFQYINIY